MRTFGNPAAELYREEIGQQADAFSVIAFAIFAAGYGPDNYLPSASGTPTAYGHRDPMRRT